MSLLVFQHAANESPSALGTILRDHGHRLKVIKLYENQPLPVDLDDVDGIVAMGGPQNLDDANRPDWIDGEMALIKQAHEAKIPVVGICLGAQLIAAALGGKVEPMDTPEVGWHQVKLAFPGTMDTAHAGIPWLTWQFHLHSQQITELPPGGTSLSGTKATPTQAFNVGFRTYGFQYHFEWTREELKAFASDELVSKAGANPSEIEAATDEHYDQYRRLGNRLCERLALLIFPLSKKVVA